MDVTKCNPCNEFLSLILSCDTVVYREGFKGEFFVSLKEPPGPDAFLQGNKKLVL